MVNVDLEKGAIYEIEESQGFGKAPAVYSEVKFRETINVVNWRESASAGPEPTKVHDFVTGSGARVLVPDKRLHTARRLLAPEE